MSKIVTVYHSGYGHTKRMAEAVAAGAGAQLIAIDAEGNLLDVRIKRPPAAPEVAPWIIQMIRKAAPFPPPMRSWWGSANSTGSAKSITRIVVSSPSAA